MSKRGPKHEHHSAGNRQYRREISCEELLQLAARSLRDARTNHDRGKTILTELSKQYLRDIATDGGALARCRDCFPLESVPPEVATVDASEPSVATTIEEDEFTGRAVEVHRYTNAPAQELGVEHDATNRLGALNGTDTEHVAASAGEVASNGEQPASQKSTAHTRPLSLTEHSFRDREAIPSL